MASPSTIPVLEFLMTGDEAIRGAAADAAARAAAREDFARLVHEAFIDHL